MNEWNNYRGQHSHLDLLSIIVIKIMTKSNLWPSCHFSFQYFVCLLVLILLFLGSVCLFVLSLLLKHHPGSPAQGQHHPQRARLPTLIKKMSNKLTYRPHLMEVLFLLLFNSSKRTPACQFDKTSKASSQSLFRSGLQKGLLDI